MLRELVGKLKLVSSLLPAVRTADANGSAADLQGYDSAEIVAHIGLSGDTLSGSVKMEVEVEHSDDNSSWSDCADADLSSTVTGTNTGTIAVIDAAADDEQIYKSGYKGNKRYVRVVFNYTGTHTNGLPASAMIIAGHPHQAPVA